MEQSKHLLIFSYYFPPNDGVGGRRWVKFAYYLAQAGYKITIVTTQVYSKELSFWKNDIHPSITILRMNDNYPSVVLNQPNGLIEKIKYKLAIREIKKKYKGNIYDVSSFTANSINGEIKNYILENKIKNIIVSGTPFSYFFYVCELANQIQGLNIMLDYRDLWTDSKYHYGQNVLNSQGIQRFDMERQMEKIALNTCNHIFVVSRDLKDILCKFRPEIHSKISILPNGFDTRDSEINTNISHTEKVFPINKNVLVFSYFGTINCGRNYFQKFLDGLNKLSNKFPIQVNFYGNTNKQFEVDLLALKNENIRIQPRISVSQMEEIAQKSDVLLYIKREDELPNSFATKFYDYLRLRKFIVILSPEGDVTNFIKENNIGFVLNENEIYLDLVKLIEEFKGLGLNFNGNLDLNTYTVESIAKQMESYFID